MLATPKIALKNLTDQDNGADSKLSHNLRPAVKGF